MQENYSKIPSKVKYNNCICPNAKLLYGEISLLCYTNGYCYATNKFFSNLLNVTTRTITRLIKELLESKLIRIEYSDEGIRKIYIIE